MLAAMSAIGTKRTCFGHRGMSANDPKRTSDLISARLTQLKKLVTRYAAATR